MSVASGERVDADYIYNLICLRNSELERILSKVVHIGLHGGTYVRDAELLHQS